MLHYQTSGSPTEPAVCFLHGFMGSAADWSPITDALAEEAYCVAVDLPGHGDSLGAEPHEYTMEGVTQSLADVFDELGIDACAVVGYSMGGRVGLYFSLFHPSRVQRLVLESTSPGIEDPGDRAERRDVDDRRAQAIREDLRGFLEDWYRMPLFESLQRHDLVAAMVHTRSQNDPDELAKALRGLSPGRQPSLWPHLPNLKPPTLLLTGALDDKYRPLTDRFADTCPVASRILVSNAGHNVHAERPQVFLSHLVEFLNHRG